MQNIVTPNVQAVEMRARAMRAAYMRGLVQGLVARLRGAARSDGTRGAAAAV